MRLQLSKFIAWLRAKPAVEVIGKPGDCVACPIAEFYSQTSGGCEVSIFNNEYGTGYIIDRGYCRKRVPLWAADFISRVDGSGFKEITAERALAMLDVA